MKNEAFRQAILFYRDNIIKMTLREMIEQGLPVSEEGALGRLRLREYLTADMQYLAEAIAADNPVMFADYMLWRRSMLLHQGAEDHFLIKALGIIKRVIKAHLAYEMHEKVDAYFDIVVNRSSGQERREPSHIPAGHKHEKLAAQYLKAILAGNRQQASELILGAVENDAVPVREIYLDVFQSAQYELGRFWQTNKINVAQEHLATAITQFVMSLLYPRLLTHRVTGLTLVATCAGGELHELGIRMVCDFFEMNGWHTVYLGASSPIDSVVEALAAYQADALAISTTMAWHVGNTERLIKAVRASRQSDVKILVGGYPFNSMPNLWRKVGADLYSPNAEKAVADAESLLLKGEAV